MNQRSNNVGFVPRLTLASLPWPLLPPTHIAAWGRAIAASPYHPNAAGMAAVAQPVLTTLAEDR